MDALHRIDPEAAGLGDYGRPGNYFERQIARWSKQYLHDTDAGRDPWMDRLVEWWPSHVPLGEETAIVHGDFRCDNAIFHPAEPRVIAVLDCDNTGRPPIAPSDYAFCVAFNFFRFAAIFHGIKGRVIRGTAASVHAKERAESLPRLIELATRALEQCA